MFVSQFVNLSLMLFVPDTFNSALLPFCTFPVSTGCCGAMSKRVGWHAFVWCRDVNTLESLNGAVLCKWKGTNFGFVRTD